MNNGKIVQSVRDAEILKKNCEKLNARIKELYDSKIALLEFITSGKNHGMHVVPARTEHSEAYIFKPKKDSEATILEGMLSIPVSSYFFSMDGLVGNISNTNIKIHSYALENIASPVTKDEKIEIWRGINIYSDDSVGEYIQKRFAKNQPFLEQYKKFLEGK